MKKELVFEPVAPVATTSKSRDFVDRVAEDHRRLGIDVTPAVHASVKEAAARSRSIKAYILDLIEKHGATVSPPSREFPAMRSQRRIVLDLPARMAAELEAKSAERGFKHFNDFVLACLESGGIQIFESSKGRSRGRRT